MTYGEEIICAHFLEAQTLKKAKLATFENLEKIYFRKIQIFVPELQKINFNGIRTADLIFLHC